MLVNLIADELEIKRQDIFLLEDKLDLHPTEIYFGSYLSYDYNQEDVSKIYAYFGEIKKAEQEKTRKAKEQKAREHKLFLDQMHKEHPLVKDDKFFKLSYFPDIVPNCFKGEDFEN